MIKYERTRRQEEKERFSNGDANESEEEKGTKEMKSETYPYQNKIYENLILQPNYRLSQVRNK